jgi:hypothetical protein
MDQEKEEQQVTCTGRVGWLALWWRLVEWLVRAAFPLGAACSPFGGTTVDVVYSRKKIPWRFPPDDRPDFPAVRLLGAGERVPTMERGGDRSNALANQGGSAGKDSAGRSRRWPVVEVVVTPYWNPFPIPDCRGTSGKRYNVDRIPPTKPLSPPSTALNSPTRLYL